MGIRTVDLGRYFGPFFAIRKPGIFRMPLSDRAPAPSFNPINNQDVLFAAAVTLGPALLLWHLRGLWNPNGAYAYGWAVPLLAAFLFKFRWDDRPCPSASIRQGPWLLPVLALLTLPARWLQEAAPERSLCAWTYAAAAVGTSLTLISLAGGVAWLRWFSFPFAFILTAVPWTHRMEMLVSDHLMRGTARATVEVLCLIGIQCAPSGNLVQINTGVIDIDEACSGIRSLQAMVMMSLFLGELFRLKPWRRLALMGAGLAFTLVANLLRTVVLGTVGTSQGMDALDRYHNAAGICVLALSLSATLLTAFLFCSAKTPAHVAIKTHPRLRLPVALSVALLIWFCLEEVAVETWYRLREPKWDGWSWAIQWPRHADDFHFVAIPQRSLRLLMCDESHAAIWKEPDGSDWSLFWLRWNPGNPAAEAAKVHRPDVCLNAEGAVMESDMGMHMGAVGRARIPFHSYTFQLGDKTLYVFFCLYEEGLGSASNPQFEGVDMFERALEGRRRIGEQTLEVALSGYPSELSAREAFNARLGALMQIRQGAVSGRPGSGASISPAPVTARLTAGFLSSMTR